MLKYLIVPTLIVALVQGCPAQTFTICEATNPQPPVIAISPSCSSAEELAAQELARYVRVMAAADLSIVRTDDPPDHSIVIRCVSRSELGDEGYSISVRGSRLYIEGARGRSVLYAVYDILERMGCRWLAPDFDFYALPTPTCSPTGAENEVVPRVRPLVLTIPKPIIEKPTLKYRKICVEEGLSHNQQELLRIIEWMPKARYNTLVIPIDYQGTGRVKWDNWRQVLAPELQKRDLIIEVGGHGYQNFLSAKMENGRLFKEHPEWFGMDVSGRRRSEPQWVFCTSNEDAVRYFTSNVLAYLKTHPEIDVFDCWPPDGATWCNCSSCRALGSPADRQSRLVRQVMDAALQNGVRTRFECIAYGSCLYPPDRESLPNSLLVDFCPIGQCFEHQIYDTTCERNARYASAFKKWRASFPGEISIYSYYRKYAWRSLPNLIPHYIQRDLQWYCRMGAAGVSTYAEPGDWRTYELNHYTLGRLAWNPYSDVDSLIRDFALARFRKAADAAIRVYQALENTVRRVSSIPYISPKTSREIDSASSSLRGALDRFLQQAEPGPATRALAAAVEYAMRDFALQKARVNKLPVQERAAMVSSLLAFIQAHSGEGLIVDARIDKAKLFKAYGLDLERDLHTPSAVHSNAK
ncbi:MAG: DUF4838 domain-containing protein [Armatimonadota bacterium]|nr:DUF4838 domain-containing protein [Armatimonadota bacterium]